MPPVATSYIAAMIKMRTSRQVGERPALAEHVLDGLAHVAPGHVVHGRPLPVRQEVRDGPALRHVEQLLHVAELDTSQNLSAGHIPGHSGAEDVVHTEIEYPFGRGT
jgi:hypothetical protein